LAVADGEGQAARDDLDLAGPLRRLAVAHRDDVHGVPTGDEKMGKVRAVGRRPTDVGRPDAGEERDPHAKNL
jgi:hypothetical protein